jgi:hypothetical protein
MIVANSQGPFVSRVVNGSGNITYSGFSGTPSSATCLYVKAQVFVSGAGGACVITGNIGSVETTMANLSASAAITTYTMAIPAGTDLSTVSVNFKSSAILCTTAALDNTVNTAVYDIYIQ